jgi:hypothetical protein
MNDCVFSYNQRPSIASPPDAKVLIKAPFKTVSSFPSISLLMIILASFLSTTQDNAFAGSGFPNLLLIRHLALNSNTKSSNALRNSPVSVPLPEFLEPLYPYHFLSS